MTHFGQNVWNETQNRKSVSARFVLLWFPNFMQKIKKIVTVLLKDWSMRTNQLTNQPINETDSMTGP